MPREGDSVVLLHGFTSNGKSWGRHGCVDLFAGAGLRVLAPDLPGHGRSGPVRDPATRALRGPRCCTTRRARDRAGIPVGFSMGGGIALQVAMERPERVTRLAIAGVGDAAINGLHDPTVIAELAEVFAADSAEVPAGTSAARIRRNAELAGNDPRALLPYLQQGRWPGGLRELARVQVPTLVVLAEDDEHMAEANALLAWLATTKVVRLPRKGHYDVLDDETAKREVVAFLAR